MYDKCSKRGEFYKGQGLWLYNPKRQKGHTPKLDVPWEGPDAIVTVISGILCEIQLNRGSKSRIVHVDKLVPVKVDFNGYWVHNLPKKHEVSFSEDHLEAVPLLFIKPN